MSGFFPLEVRFVLSLVIVVMAGVFGGCDDPSQGDPDPEIPAESPRWMTPETDAEKVAARIFKKHGGPDWESVESVAFTFVFVDDGERLSEVTHRWDIDDGIDRVQWRDDEGQLWDIIVDIDAETAREATVDGEAVTGDDLDDAGAQGFRRWVNDTYWLLMPIKLFDSGVMLSPGEETAEDVDHDFDVLELSFDGVGITPGDCYEIRADRQSGEVRWWQMDLEGRQELIDVEWTDYEQVGPLYLPMTRNWRSGDRRILLKDVVVESR